MEANEDTCLEPLTDDNDDKGSKGGKLLSVAICSYPPSQNTGTPLATFKQCFKVEQECFNWNGWACYNCRSSVQSTSTTDGSARQMCISNQMTWQAARSQPRWLWSKIPLTGKGWSSGARPKLPLRMMTRWRTKGKGRQLTPSWQNPGSKVSVCYLSLLLTFWDSVYVNIPVAPSTSHLTPTTAIKSVPPTVIPWESNIVQTPIIELPVWFEQGLSGMKEGLGEMKKLFEQCFDKFIECWPSWRELVTPWASNSFFIHHWGFKNRFPKTWCSVWKVLKAVCWTPHLHRVSLMA